MAKKEKGINIFDLDGSYGGGQPFAAGLYRIESPKFAKFDFMGKSSKGAVVALCITLQPLSAAREAVGDKLVQWWPAETGPGDLMVINDGAGIKFNPETAKHEKIWKQTDFAIFMEYLAKAEFDMDKYDEEGDITVLDQLVVEMGEVERKGSGKKVTNDEGKEVEGKAFKTIVVTAIPKSKGGAAKSEKKESKSAKAEEAAEESSTSDASELLEQYLDKELLTKKNEENGVEKQIARVNISKYYKDKGNDVVQSVVKEWNKTASLVTMLTVRGWEIKGDRVVKSEE